MANDPNNTYLVDANKDYTRVLFRPGYTPQDRELNAIQESLMRQITSIGDHLFKDGSQVLGGTIKSLQGKSLLIESTFGGNAVDVSAFMGQTIVEFDSAGIETGARGTVFAVSPETPGDPACLHYTDENVLVSIGSGSTIRISGSSTFASIRSFEQPVRDCLYARLLGGIFYFNKTFVRVDDQLIVYSKFDDLFSGYVGLQFTKKIVTEFDDKDLLNKARGFANFNGAGAHRELYQSSLISYSYNEERPANFVSLMEIQQGSIKAITTEPQYNEIQERLASDQDSTHGDFVVNYFKADLVDHITVPIKIIEPSRTSAFVLQATTAIPHNYSIGDPIRIDETSSYAGDYKVKEVLSTTVFTFDTARSNTVSEKNKTVYRTDHFGVQISAGKAYVKGYPVVLPGMTNIEIPKARTVDTIRNSALSVGYGRYVQADTLTGMFDTANKQQVLLRNASNATVGTARVHAVTKSGTKSNVYLFDIAINTGADASTITNIYAATGANGTAVTASFSSFNVRSANDRSLFQQIANYKIATLRPENVDSLSYTTLKILTAASASNSVTFALTGTDTFSGARGTDIKASNLWLTEYSIVKADGSAVTPTSVIIASDGKSITINAASMTGNITISAPVQIIPAVKKKTLKTKSYSTSAVTGTVRKYTFDVVDAISATVHDSTGADVTSLFKFDSGQRDDIYDFSSVTLQSGSVVPSAPLTIDIKYFEHSGTGYFSVDSYTGIDFSLIPSYVSEDLQTEYELTDIIDFRYVKTGASTYASSLTPIPEGFTVVDFNYYLPRKDIISLTKNGAVNIVGGLPSLNSIYPSISDSEMALFKVDILAFTKDYKEDVFIYQEQNRRYTMKDIGKIDQRVSRLEYETSLSLLESKAKTEDIVDVDGNSRYKTGFLVDNFSGHGVGDISSSDYRAAIDKENLILRPAFDQNAVGLDVFEIDGFSRVGNTDVGYFMTLPFTSEVLSENLIASKAVSVNPYLVTKRRGTALLNPSSDFWKDSTTAPVRNVDMTSDVNPKFNLGTVWNDWEETWSGSTTTRNSRNNSRTTTTTTREQRTGVRTSVDFVDTTQTIGKFVVDVNVSYYMRKVDIAFKLAGMRPDTDLHVFVDKENIDNLVSGVSTAPVGEGSVRTDGDGNAAGKIGIPNGRFRTGERLITFSDEPNNVSENATTEASFIFASSGLNVTEQTVTLSTSVPQLTRTPVSETRTSTTSNTVRDRIPVRNMFGNSGNNTSNGAAASDPLAQSVWISPDLYPNGAFLSEITVYMKRKPVDTSHPLILQIRPTVNGYPSSNHVNAFSEINVPNANVKIPTNTNDLNSILAAPTVIEFPVPIYVQPNDYFNFVLLSSHSDYEAYMSEMGQKIIGTDIQIYKQPVLGSSFRSQNGGTWTAYQNEDIMHSVKICKWTPNTLGSFSFRNLNVDELKYNTFNFRPQVIKFQDHVTEYTLTSRDSTTSNNVIERIVEDTNNDLKSERIIRDDTPDVKIGVVASTLDQYTAPLYEVNKCYAMLVSNVINNFGLVRRNFLIVNGGTGYTDDSVVTFTGGGGTGAVYKVKTEGGIIVDLIEVNQGSGYTSAPTVAVSGGTGAQITFSGVETDPINGNADARYVSKVVTLEDDYTTDRADIYLDISAPSGSDVKMYFRAKNNADAESIQLKEWTEITQNNRKTSTTDEFIETKFTADVTYTADNGAVFDEVNSVQVKIVLLSNNTSVVPKCKNFRFITSI
ncbi:putative adsorption associated tail protein [Rhizobium phage RHph_Y68]|uniref:Putative adsorption associated tail protein n=1 Tax=Rhizobium phage RHph_Y68 TaxID=2509787 RepID=A0A7S5R9D8_9CAUD|nr:putative adsorption associated tail protein [Rhizobium phage RHph_Y68]QIG67949.1 putative adsorption associated tail protein [Rhizobium phage RHph_Y68]